MSTPRLALPYIQVQQAQKEVAHSEGLVRLDALVQTVVQQVGLNSPPGSPTNGQLWIVGAAPTGVWAGNANRLAQRLDSAWRFYAAATGWRVWDITTAQEWAFTGMVWAATGSTTLSGSATHDPPNLADGAGATTTVTVTGAALGDFTRASFSLNLQGITVTAWVSAADTVSVRFQNESGGALDLGSGTLRVKVEKP
jgi:hypothetical protein